MMALRNQSLELRFRMGHLFHRLNFRHRKLR
jgi:hypothetical protein